MRIALALTLLLASGAAFADDDAGCAKFKWSIAREREAFAAPKPLGADGALVIGEGFRVALADGAKVTYPATPERAPKPDTHGAALALHVAREGTYDVTLSDPGWVDMADHATIVTASDFSGQKGCPGVHKSVRYQLKGGDYVVQLSSIAGEAVNIAVVPAP